MESGVAAGTWPETFDRFKCFVGESFKRFLLEFLAKTIGKKNPSIGMFENEIGSSVFSLFPTGTRKVN